MFRWADCELDCEKPDHRSSDQCDEPTRRPYINLLEWANGRAGAVGSREFNLDDRTFLSCHFVRLSGSDRPSHDEALASRPWAIRVQFGPQPSHSVIRSIPACHWTNCSRRLSWPHCTERHSRSLSSPVFLIHPDCRPRQSASE